MADNALDRNVERREYRRVSDAVVTVRGRVVNSGEDRQKGDKDRFFAGIAFKGLSDEQRETILEHIDGVAKKSFGGAVKLIYKK